MCEALSLRGGAHLWEHPADPEIAPLPSIFATEEFTASEKRTGAKRATFHQCQFGGVTMKPTTVSSTLDRIEELDGIFCQGGHQHGKSSGLNELGVFNTRRLQSYPNKLNLAFAFCISETLRRFKQCQSGPVMHRPLGCRPGERDQTKQM